MKQILLNRILLMMSLVVLFGIGKVTGQTTVLGSFTFEGNNTTGLTGSGGGSAPIAANSTLTNVRTGSYSLKFGNPSGLVRYFYIPQTQPIGETWFVIGWAKLGPSSTATGVGATLTGSAPVAGTYTTPNSTTWTRFSISKTFTTASTKDVRWYGNFGSTAATDLIYYDDLIYYKSTTSTTIDLTGPTAATAASGYSCTGLSWTNGADAGTGATGIQNTLIFKRTAGTNGSNDLILNDQGQYSLTSTTGPSIVGNWTLIDAGVSAAATSYSTGTFTAGEEYAIVHSDLIYNYSAPAYVALSLCSGSFAPVINAQAFSVDENSPNGTAVGTVTASDADAGQTLSYSIIAGNTGNVFAINSSTGDIAVNGALNFEATSSYPLTVKVSDNGGPVRSVSATVTVTINNVNETPVLAAQTFAINENSANGTALGTVVASDVDAGQVLSYSITAGDPNNVFTINGATGAITVNATLDYESTTSYSLIVQVSDNGTPVLSNSKTVTVNVNNLNEFSPSIPANIFAVDENSTNGTSVGTVTATDADPGQILSYSITAGNTGNVFAINSSTGEITVNGALNFEIASAYSLTVQASDNGIPVRSSSATVTVNINDVNETPVLAAQTFAIDENSANGTAVGTVIASDVDASQTLIYSITAGDPNNVFVISSATGAITVNDNTTLDYESTTSYSLTVQVTDNGTPVLSNSKTVTINVNNLNEFSPSIPANTFAVDENSTNGTSVGTVTATDADPGQTLSYSFASGNTGNVFAINSSTGEITVNGALNFEIASAYSLTVQASDNGIPARSTSATVTITINDLNETPVLAPQTFTIDENSVNGAVVGTVIASDVDGGQTLSYSITAGDPNNAFSINSATGVVGVSGPLDFETTSSYSLTVQVSDNGASVKSASATITVNINNVDENPSTPVIGSQHFSVDESSANGTSVGTVIASDADASQTLSYSIPSGSPFTINSSTGEITVSGALDFETTSSYSLTVQVSDNGVPVKSASATITVNINNVDENLSTPIISNQSFSADENSTNGTSVGTVTATDADAGQTLSYSIPSGSPFTINSSTGEITVSGALDFETTPSYSLTVQVSDNGVPMKSVSATVTITINNISENPSTPVISNQTFAVYENSANGTAVGTVTATDADADQILSYSIPTGSPFTINSSTGEITVSETLNFETTSSYSLTVQVSDNGVPVKSASATITVDIYDENENPVIGNQTFSVDENSINGTSVGTVIALDVDAGQTLSYSISSGSPFAINSSTGEITVTGTLDFETTPSYTLIVLVSDNGSPVLSGSATVTININNLVETGIADADFNSGIKIYPNPSYKNLYIESNGNDLSGAKVKIVNALGAVVLETDFMNALVLQGIDSGMYTLIITLNGKTAVKKLVIQ